MFRALPNSFWGRIESRVEKEVSSMSKNRKILLVKLLLAYVVITRLVTPSYLAFAFRGPVSDLNEKYTCDWNLIDPQDVTEENLDFLIETGVCQKVGEGAEQPLLPMTPMGDDDDDDDNGSDDRVHCLAIGDGITADSV